MQHNWFENWFDSPYYHLLYSHRNYSEAEHFITNLFGHLNLPKGSKVLDLACGKGRHALQIHNLGNNVIGLDLSPQSIDAANAKAEKGLSFQTGDMRNLSFNSEFDLVVNLFTSFGYFKQEGDNVKVIKSIARSLRKDGLLVLDYLNVSKVVSGLPTKETIVRKDISFDVSKTVIDGFIVKTIKFEDQEENFEFREHVKLISLVDFERIFEVCGFEVKATFGDYNLNRFEENTSERLIFIARKINE